jgi:hypothetical protein
MRMEIALIATAILLVACGSSKDVEEPRAPAVAIATN